MNKYELRAERDRKAALRFSVLLWTAAAGLIIVVLALLGFISAAPTRIWKSAAIVMAILLLAFRQVSRQLSKKAPRAAEPDARSRLNLD